MGLPDARSTQPEARGTATKKTDATNRSLINNALAFAQKSHIEPELSDSSVDLDLQKVEREIAKLSALKTTDDIQRSLNKVLAKIKVNERERANTFSPYRRQEIDELNTKLAVDARSLVELSIGAKYNGTPSDSEIAKQLGPLLEQRKKLLANAQDRRTQRSLREQKRFQALLSDKEKIQASLGFEVPRPTVVRRPLTDFEAAIAEHPYENAPIIGGYASGKGIQFRPILSPKTGDPVQYVYDDQGTIHRYDIFGKYLGTRETPLQEPDVDPIDALFIAEGLGRLAVKGVVAGGKIAVAQATKLGGKITRKAVIAGTAAIMGGETAVPLLTRSASQAMSETSIGYAGRSASEQAQNAVARGVEREVGQAARGTATRNATTTLVREEGQVFAEASEEGLRSAPKQPADVAQALRDHFGGRLIDNDNALEKLIVRIRHETLRATGRAAAAELRDAIRLLNQGAIDGKTISSVELVPSSSAGRTPDLRINFSDGTQKAWEVRAITGAPRNHVVPKMDGSPGAVARSLADAAQNRDVAAKQIAEAIWSKAKNLPTRPSQVSGGGTISVNITVAKVSTSDVARAMSVVAPRLGAHVERIEISLLGERSSPTEALERLVMAFVRQADGTYLLSQ